MNDTLSFPALVALIGWIPVVVLLFMLIPIRRALLATLVIGWLFLPQSVIPVPGILPDYDRFTALAGGALLGLLILDFSRLASFRPAKLDMVMVVWTLVPLAASLSNGLGAHDGVSAVLGQALMWSAFYVLGRIYLADQDGIQAMALAVFLGTLLYVPLVLYEMRMSPQLHNMVYGFHQHTFGQTYRLGGWRPMVFLQHGLSLGMWLTGATLLGGCLWRSGALRKFQGAEVFCLGAVVVAAVFSRSTFALVLLALGVAVIGSVRFFRSPWPLILVTLLPVAYVGGRLSGAWDGSNLVTMARDYVNADRAQSIEYRLDNEDVLIEKALERPVFGWGGWGRSRVRSEESGKTTVTDGFWILTMGRYGLVGLAAGILIHLLPVWCFMWVVPARHWFEQNVVVAFGVAVYLALYMVDNLMNAMLNPFTMLGAGALIGLVEAERAARTVVQEEAVPILSTKELLGVPEEALEVYAQTRWGQAEYVRRDREVREAWKGLDPDDWQEWREQRILFRRVILSVGREQVERFLQLPVNQQKGLALFLTGQGARKPSLK